MALIKTAEEIAKIAKAGAILAKGRQAVVKAAKPGVTGIELDDIFLTTITKEGGVAIFKNYQPGGATRPYPAATCISINEVIVHAPPTNYKMKAGDIVGIDLGVGFAGYCADSAVTVAIGKFMKPEARKLVEVTREALHRGIKAAQWKATLGDIGYAISSYVKEQGFYVVKGLTGHGIGTDIHEEPHVFNEGTPGKGVVLEPGMCLAIEPMVAIGTNKLMQMPDESYASADGSLTAHFEHTIVITEKGPKILTA